MTGSSEQPSEKTRVGPYRLLERIGIGGMAEVFVARRADAPDSAPTVVVKRMLPNLTRDAAAVTMFRDEARLGAQLVHPNIVRVVEHGQDDSGAYIVLEHVDGLDAGELKLRARQRSQTVPPVHAAWIVQGAAAGLAYAHTAKDPKTGASLGVIHRDVSPGNILIGRNGDVKVSDFGVARSNVQSARTGTGILKGKIAYMSPEQLSGEPVDVRSDVYALGCVLWELLTGQRLHEGKSDLQIMKVVQRGDPPPSCSAFRPVPIVLDELAQACLHRDPDRRPPSAGHVQDILQRWIAAQGPAAGRAAFERWLSAERMFSTLPRPPAPPDLPTVKLKTPSGVSRALPEGDTQPALKRATQGTPPTGLKLSARAPTRKLDRVLYVEDEAENRDVAALRLRRSYDLVLAENDEQACRILREEGSTITAILMDIQLKGSKLDGIELVKLVRGQLPEEKKPPYARGLPLFDGPILFVTAYSARYSEAELLATGAQKLVTKPVNFGELTLALVDLHLRRASRA